MRLAACGLLIVGFSAAAAETKLWYTRPATNWEMEALPSVRP